MTSTTAARVCRSAPCALQLGHTYIPPPGSGLSRVCVIPDLLSGTISRYSLAQSSAHIPCMYAHTCKNVRAEQWGTCTYRWAEAKQWYKGSLKKAPKNYFYIDEAEALRLSSSCMHFRLLLQDSTSTSTGESHYYCTNTINTITGDQTRATIEVTLFARKLFWKTGLLNPKSSIFNSCVEVFSILHLLGPWDWSSGRTSIFLINQFLTLLLV